MKRNDAFKSNYLGKDDFPVETLCQVAHVVEEQIKDRDTGQSSGKPVLYIMGPSRPVDCTKGIILNVGNWTMLEEITGKKDSDEWENARIVVYTDQHVMFGGKRVGGLRIRAPRQQAAQQQAPPQPVADETIPF